MHGWITRGFCAVWLLAGAVDGLSSSGPSLGHIGADGTLCFQIRLGVIEGPGYSIPVEMDHRIAVDYAGAAKSVWQIPAFESYLVAISSSEWEVQFPTGERERFEFLAGSQALGQGAHGRAWVRGDVSGRYEIQSAEGEVYVFKSSRLNRIDIARNTIWFSVVDSGIRITRGESGALLGEIQRSEIGEPVRVSLHGRVFRFIYDKQRLLRAVCDRDDKLIAELNYRGNLLQTVSMPNRPVVRIEWRLRSDGGSTATVLDSPPVTLAAVDDERYDVSARGPLRILRRSLVTSGRRDALIIDTLSGSVTHEEDGYE